MKVSIHWLLVAASLLVPPAAEGQQRPPGPRRHFEVTALNATPGLTPLPVHRHRQRMHDALRRCIPARSPRGRFEAEATVAPDGRVTAFRWSAPTPTWSECAAAQFRERRQFNETDNGGTATLRVDVRL